MKKIFAAAAISFSILVTGPGIGTAFAQAKKVDRNSEEHRKWQEEFKKKHGIKEKKAPEKKKPAQKKKPVERK